MRLISIAAVLLGLTTAAHADRSHVYASLNVGGATSQPDHLTLGNQGVNTCPMAQLQIKVKNALGPITLNGEVRNAFCSSGKKELWNKSRYCLGVEAPVGTNTVLFAAYERYYHQNDDWAWAGVSFRFGN